MSARRKLRLPCMLFGVISSQIPVYLYNKIERRLNKSEYYTARSVTNPLVTTSHMTAFNDIPPPVRDLKTLYCFKLHRKKILLNVKKEDPVYKNQQ